MRTALLLLALTSFAAAQDFSTIDQSFKDFAERQHIPGGVWGIIIDGKLAHAGAYGYRELDQKTSPNADTVFRIASMTKSFTALSILKLRDEGKLALDDPAEKYIPELASLKYPTSDSPKLTVRHLLSHSTGFPEDNPWGDQQLSISDEQFTQMIKSGIPFSNAPGIAYEYSNYGFMLLGRIVSRVSGKPYPEFVKQNILVPLGMTSTTLEPSSVPPDRLAHGYRWEDEQWKEEKQLANGAGGSMGGMLTTINDLSKYVAMYLSAFPPHDGPETAPIKRASLREMQQMWRPGGANARVQGGNLTMRNSGYAFGLGVAQSCTFRYIVSHSGGLPGFGTLMVWLPDYNAGAIAFANRTYTSFGPPLTAALESLAQSGVIKPREAMPSPALVQARNDVSQLVIKWDDALADRIAAMNLFLDQSKERRRAGIERLHERVGACTAPTAFNHVENALRGNWLMDCERGQIQVSITLAPTSPPKVQFLGVSTAPPEPPRGTCSTAP